MTGKASLVSPAVTHPVSARAIRLRGVRVNNLKGIDLDIPHGQLLCLCGLSGSGKTSLALDTLFAEGQRRYIECFSPYTRQFLKQWDKPDADRIDGIPPAIAVTAIRGRGSNRTTIGSITETIEYLRLLFARIATPTCPDCDLPVVIYSPQSIAAELNQRGTGTRFQIAFPFQCASLQEFEAKIAEVRANGFRRLIAGSATVEVDDAARLALIGQDDKQLIYVVVDRLVVELGNQQRVIDSLETAMRQGNGAVVVLTESGNANAIQIDSRGFEVLRFQNRLMCGNCQRTFQPAEPNLFSHNSPHGACHQCGGFGNVPFADIDKIVPDMGKSIRQGAIVPWTTPAYEHELAELIAIAPHHDLPLDVPFRDLEPRHVDVVWKGDPSRKFGGLDGFLAWLSKRKYKVHLRANLARWRSYTACDACQGNRLKPDALAWRIGNRNIAELSHMPVVELKSWLSKAFSDDVKFTAGDALRDGNNNLPGVADLVNKVQQRLGYLIDIGLGYLSLDRTVISLGNGERQRVALTRALGSSLVNLLYVLDEPSSGLHPYDIEKLIPQIQQLQTRRNTVVMIEHNPRLIPIADRVLEIGPAAGQAGGDIVFDGSPTELVGDASSVTGPYLSGERGWIIPEERRTKTRGSLRMTGARGNNLKSIDVTFPLGMLCVVTGVSGSGKSTLVRQTLAPALQQKTGSAVNESPLGFDELRGGDLIDEVVLIDQQSLMKTSRSNPATYIKAYDEIRKVFSLTPDARAKGMKPGHFSFNVSGGRCDTCQGEGFLTIDMRFMADVLKRCDECQGTRFQTRVREVRFRDRSISDVLNMTVDEAFGFFRGHKKVQKRLKLLKDAGLDYVQLGQPLSTLSSGESQRLRLASFLGSSTSKRTLFIMDEPTSGLHLADVRRLITSFNALIDVGHSIIVIEHNLLMMVWADHIIDMGPGPADKGGRVVATGTPEQICDVPQSITGRYLRTKLAADVSD